MMKRLYTIMAWLLVLLLSSGVSEVYALPTSGDWGKTTIKTNEEVHLTGNVSLKGTITIAEKCTLTIYNDSKEPFFIRKVWNGSNMFTVNGSLIIKGNADGQIFIDGGANFEWSKKSTPPYMELKSLNESGYTATYGINNGGYLELDYVTIQHVNNSNGTGGAIQVNSSSTEQTILNKH